MPVEVGNQTQVAYIQEAAFGTTPASPAGQILRWTGVDVTADAKYIDDPELRLDGMRTVGRRGGLVGRGSLSGKLSYGTYDDFLAAALGNTFWNSNIAKVVGIVASSASSIAVDSVGKTFTRVGGSFVTDGFVVGQTIVTSGDSVNAGNNGSFVISAVTATVITCSTATTLVTNASVALSIMVNRRPSFTIEKAHKGNGIYLPFTGAVVEGFEMSGKVNEAVDVKFNLVTKAVGNEATASVFASTVAINTNPLITAWDGSIKKGGVTIGNIMGWTIKAGRPLDEAAVCGSPNLYDIQPKTFACTGSLEIYFDSIAQYTDFRAENDIAYQINLGPGGTKSYTLDFTKCRVKKWGAAPKDGLMTQTVEFESYAPDAGTNTSLMITRLP